MKLVHIQNSFASWREAARGLVKSEIIPADVFWETDETTLEFAEPEFLKTEGEPLRVPKRFVQVAQKVANHTDSRKWSFLYEALWWLLHGEKHLFELVSDPLVRELISMEKSVSRNAYKVTSFVRFREVQHEDGAWFVAWHEPEHDVAELIFPFFRDRFTNMRWSILTPFRCVHWDMEKGWYTPGLPKNTLPEDNLLGLWKTYYASTFNPARLKLKAMQAQMPKKYWKNMPETTILPELIKAAEPRVEKMLKQFDK